jgi:3-hydroxyisobutyrate dehydrogenase-like beta-hydroxyacid dehydrogenase
MPDGDLIMHPNVPAGIVGLGLIGTALSERLIDAKVPMIGFDIEAAGRDALTARGGTVATSLRELATRSRTIIVAVYSGDQVEALFDDLVNGAGPARPTVVCTTTCAPNEIIRLSRRDKRPYPVRGSADIRYQRRGTRRYGYRAGGR